MSFRSNSPNDNENITAKQYTFSDYEEIEKADEENNVTETAFTDETTDKKKEFEFTLPSDLWLAIAPQKKTYGRKGRESRKLSGDWTTVFAENLRQSHPGCTLTFQYHNVKKENSRKVTLPFMKAVAECTDTNCCAKFEFTIEREPLHPQDVTVHFTVTGYVRHDPDEVKRRHLKGEQRAIFGERLAKSSASEVYYENIMKARPEEMKQGNFTAVPTQNVLRKLVSEVMQKEHMHSNVVGELEILKESYGTNQYIHDIGIDPFTVILYSDDQLELMRRLSKDDILDIYIDATGSIITAIPGQKHPYLYSVVVKPTSSLPPVSVCDMITTQHTIPRIELFLGTLKRAVNLKGQKMKVRKIETDFSMAIIQASLRQYCTTNLKEYVRRCFGICSKQKLEGNFTCLHICAAHVFSNFIRSMKAVKVSMKKETRHILLRSFAALQNATSLAEAEGIYKDLCLILISEQASEEIEQAVSRLGQTYHDELENANEDFELKTETENIDLMTIKEASPFTSIFRKIRQDITENTCNSAETKKTNQFYCPEVVDVLEDKFLPTIPMWSGMILRFLTTKDGEYYTRDTNTNAENWFKFLKVDKNIKRMRPAKFVIKLKSAIEGRLAEQKYPSARKPRTKKRTEKTLHSLDLEEELWKGKANDRKRPKHHPVEKTRKDNKSLPKVMSWGGKEQGIHLSNTCSIDNGLTIIYIFWIQNKLFRRTLQNHTSEVFQTLSSVMMLMAEEKFSAAKLIWTGYIKPNSEKSETRSKDLFGDEYELLLQYMCKEWISYTESVCDHAECPVQPQKTKEERGGIAVGLSETLPSPQTIVDRWLDKFNPCSGQKDLACPKSGPKCQGRRHVKRHVSSTAPILVVRAYEHVLCRRLKLTDILDTSDITVRGNVFNLAGITLFKEAHYCAIVVYKQQHYWYDGLKGELIELSKNTTDLKRWLPSHIIYCQGSK